MREPSPSHPEVSIVITNHNYGAFLAAALDSALDQAGSEVEVVVVDDGSDDDSDSVLRCYEGRARILRKPNGGQASAMNAGFAASTGEVVMFLDADDLLDRDVAARCVEGLRAHSNAVRVQFPLRCVDANGEDLGVLVPPHPRLLLGGDCRTAVLTRADDLPWQPTTGNAFRRSALAEIMPIPEPSYRMCADHYLSNLTPLLGEVLVLEGPGGAYRIHGGNADQRSGFDLEKTQGNIARNEVTHAAIRALAESRELAPRDEIVFRSAVSTANRLVSLRLAPDTHPVPRDSVGRLVLDGTRAAWSRRDVSPFRRLAMSMWFVATAVVPRRLVVVLAGRLGSSTQGPTVRKSSLWRVSAVCRAFMASR